MSCTNIAPGQWVCRTPMKELRREPDRIRWCFNCRKHLMHDFVIIATVEPSYYDPIARYDCPQCHQDRTCFPGYERVWEVS